MSVCAEEELERERRRGEMITQKQSKAHTGGRRLVLAELRSYFVEWGSHTQFIESLFLARVLLTL